MTRRGSRSIGAIKSIFDADQHAVSVGQISAKSRVVDDGKETIGMEFFDANTQTWSPQDISRLAKFPNLRDPFAAALARQCEKHRGPRSRLGFLGKFQSGYLCFLDATGRQNLSLEQIGRGEVRAFEAWLNRTEDHKACLTAYVRRAYYRVFIMLLDRLREDERWRNAVLPASHIPANPWPSAARTIKGTRELDRSALEKILSFVAAEVEKTVLAVSDDLAQLNAASRITTDALIDPHSASRGEVLALLQRRFLAQRKIDSKLMRREDPALAIALQREGAASVRRTICPTIGNLMPFIVLLAAQFRFNESVMLNLKLTDIDRRQWIGSERTIARPYKPRAGERQFASVAVSDDPTNPAQLLNFLERWTSNIRQLAPSDAVFIYFVRNSRRNPSQAFSEQRPSSIVAFNTSLRKYCRSNGLPRFTLNELRHAMLDLAHERTSGDIRAVQAAGSHKTPDTTVRHYVSRRGHMREDEALANALLDMDRWVLSGGRVDARVRSEHEDRSAATPGFVCLLPFESPFPEARPNTKCTAYGSCPICPHARILDPTSPQTCAQLHLVADAISRTVDVVAAEAWLFRWAPVHRMLIGGWLRLFSREVHLAAKQISHARLPTVE